MLDRRSFLQAAAKTATAAAVTTRLEPLFAQPSQAASTPTSPNDNIQLALIGAGIQGQGDTKTAIQVPGVKLVAVADCYDGRLAHSKELWGADIFTTRDYREILSRKDVDAVLIATPHYQHTSLGIAALENGLHVMVEKPISAHKADAERLIAAHLNPY